MNRPIIQLLRSVPTGILLALACLPVGLLLTLLIYGAALEGYFISDDFVWLEVARRGLDSPIHLFDRDVGNFYRPTAHLFNLLLVAGWGYSPAALHWGALLLHGLNLALLPALAWALTGQRWLALCTGLIFAILQRHHEALIWISAINEPLYGFWMLCCLLAWRAFLHRPTLAPYLLSLASLVLAMGTKEVAVTLPLLMGLVHVWLRRQGRAAPLSWSRYLPVAGILLLFTLLQARVYSQSGLVGSRQFLLEPAALIRLGRMALSALGPIWIFLPVALIGLLMNRSARSPRALPRLAWAAIVLAAALACTLLLYAPITWGPAASRFYYTPSMVVSLAGAAALALAAGSGRILPQLLALAAAVGLVLLNVWQVDEKLDLYLQDAARSRRYITRARLLPAPEVPIQILDCPLPSQHMSAAMAVFHPSHSRNFSCISRSELLRISGPRWVWRWLPRFEKFAVIERRTNRMEQGRRNQGK